eukprot:COSAG05_NODE_398_length_10293_cov_11.919176_3_plen_96_part_00
MTHEFSSFLGTKFAFYITYFGSDLQNHKIGRFSTVNLTVDLWMGNVYAVCPVLQAETALASQEERLNGLDELASANEEASRPRTLPTVLLPTPIA